MAFLRVIDLLFINGDCLILGLYKPHLDSLPFVVIHPACCNKLSLWFSACDMKYLFSGPIIDIYFAQQFM